MGMYLRRHANKLQYLLDLRERIFVYTSEDLQNVALVISEIREVRARISVALAAAGTKRVVKGIERLGAWLDLLTRVRFNRSAPILVK